MAFITPQDSGKKAADNAKLGREIFGMIFIFCGILLTVSLATFDSRDPWLNHVVSGITRAHNMAGLFGAYLGGLLLDFLGMAAWTAPAFFFLAGVRRALDSPGWPWWRWLGFLLLTVCASLAGTLFDLDLLQGAQALPGGGDISRHGGGLLGHLLYNALTSALNTGGAILVWVLIFLLALQMLVGFSWLTVVAGTAMALWRGCVAMVGSVGENRAESSLMLRGDEHTGVLHLPPGSTLSANAPRNGGNGDGETSSGAQAQRSSALPVSDVPALPEEGEQALSLVPGVVETRGRDGILRLREDEDDTELPPWVKDFEQDRVGTVPDAASGLAPAGENSGPPVEIREAAVVEQADVPHKPGLLESAVALVAKPVRIPLPPLALIEAIPPVAGTASRAELEAKGHSLMTCLADFGVQGELVGITPGPVITMFEVRPAPGVRVSRIANLSDDLALALKAVAVRIQAPVPGTDTVGIEIPNEIRETVCLRELLSSQAFQGSSSILTLALGKDIAGGPAVADLAAMPHLLVAGATGAGKSVGINSIILSLLYKARPDEVKLLLVDPKRVEMAIYADLPHLVHPVVTEMSMAKNALEWAVTEMERRYADIARAGVRNIADYNAKIAPLEKERPEALLGLEPMPYLVIIIDELADLMLVAAKEVETSIVRLAQLARAAGIHLILATQRPSVDVVTGLIKANFPCRMSFQVSSKHDSRTILDAVGAEHLLGRGDMLFKPGGGKFRRLHGAFVSDANVLKVVDYWRSRQKPDYRLDFSDWVSDAADNPAGGSGGAGDIVSDPMYADAVEFVRSQGKASISLIQRRFRIGFNKAARLVEQMEQDGLIGPADGSKPRMVIR